jgi:hypothetical protein
MPSLPHASQPCCSQNFGHILIGRARSQWLEYAMRSLPHSRPASWNDHAGVQKWGASIPSLSRNASQLAAKDHSGVSQQTETYAVLFYHKAFFRSDEHGLLTMTRGHAFPPKCKASQLERPCGRPKMAGVHSLCLPLTQHQPIDCERPCTRLSRQRHTCSLMLRTLLTARHSLPFPINTISSPPQGL